MSLSPLYSVLMSNLHVNITIPSSITLSSDFDVTEHRSPPFGFFCTCFDSTNVPKTDFVGHRCPMQPWFGPRFHCFHFATHKTGMSFQNAAAFPFRLVLSTNCHFLLAHTEDSLIRVTRRTMHSQVRRRRL